MTKFVKIGKRSEQDRADYLRDAVQRCGFSPIQVLKILWQMWGYPPMTIHFSTGAVRITRDDLRGTSLENVMP